MGFNVVTKTGVQAVPREVLAKGPGAVEKFIIDCGGPPSSKPSPDVTPPSVESGKQEE